jgi:hypothetical protein
MYKMKHSQKESEINVWYIDKEYILCEIKTIVTIYAILLPIKVDKAQISISLC